jgi:hypothetical protein
MKKVMFVMFALSFSQSVWAYGIGMSTYPLSSEKGLVSGEITGIMSNGAGMGFQGRYTHKLNQALAVDGGIGLASGSRSARLFAGVDYEIFPDYAKQPRFSMKGAFEYASEFSNGREVFTVAPTVSKGFNFWGQEAFPFVAMPIGLSLNSENQTYLPTMALALGATTKLPVETFKDMSANIEFDIGIRNSFTAIFLGLSYPI